MAEKVLNQTATGAPTPTVEPKTPKGADGVEWVPTAEKAIEVGNSRKTGARRPVEVTLKDGTKKFAVGAHIHYVAMRLCKDMGITLKEIGKPDRAAPLDAAGVVAAIGSMPEAERNAVLEQLKLLNKKK